MSIIRTGEGANQLTIDTNRKQVFAGSNFFETGETITASDADIEIAEGQVLGRAAGKLNVLKSGATDGSELPVGVSASAYTILDGESKEITMCIEGKVHADLLVFDGTDTLDTVVDERTLRDRLKADTAGIIPVVSTENTIYDN